jgi:hypothetical protein
VNPRLEAMCRARCETPLELELVDQHAGACRAHSSVLALCHDDPSDEDITPSDTTIDYMVSSFLLLHSDFRYNSLCSTRTCHYLLVGTYVSQSASPLKLNCQFIGKPILLNWEGHNSSIRSVIEVNEHLMESLLDKLSNRSCPTSISRRKSSRLAVAVSARSYFIIMGLLFILGP